MSKELKRIAVILGAGVTGLKTAAELAKAGYDVTVIEKNDNVGGMSKSFKYKDYTLDYGPHKFYSQIKGIMPEYKEILGKYCLKIEKTNSLYLLGKYFHFPPNPAQLLFGISPLVLIKLGLSYNKALIKSTINPKENRSYEDYFINGFGRAGYELLFKGLCEKVWGDPKEISEELARRRIPVPSIKEFIRNAITGAKERPDVSAKYFYYPKQGFGMFTDILHETIKKYDGKIILEATPTEIVTKNNKITKISYKDKTGNKKEIKDIDIIISTIHLEDFISLFVPSAPKDALESTKKLKYRALVLCYVFLNKKRALKDNWYFYPERDVCFNRVSEQKTFSPYTVSEDKTVITVEISCDEDSELYKKEEKDIQNIVVEDLEKVDVLKKEDIIEFFTKKGTRIYPVYNIGFRDNIKKILEFIHNFDNTYTIGRQGLFNYNNADHCMDMANLTANHIIKNGTREEWRKIIEIFDTYKIVD